MLLDDLEKRYGTQQKLGDFFNFAANLPPSLCYVEVPYRTINPKTCQAARSQFESQTHRKVIYEWFGRNFGPELIDMGISCQSVDIMVEHGIRPKTPSGRPYDFTIDHMKSLWLGGSNKMKNLCFLPGKLNHFKNVLEQMQKPLEGQDIPEMILTIMPVTKRGVRTGVPYFEDGYLPRTKNAGLKL